MSSTAILKGKLLLRKQGGAETLSTGNSTKISMSTEIEEKSIPNTMNAGGGNYDSFKRIKAIKLNCQFREMLIPVLEIAFGAKIVKSAGGAVAAETANNIVIGQLIRTLSQQDMSIPLSVKKGATTLEEGIDYLRTRLGILPLAGGSLVDGDDLTLSYSSVASVNIQGAVNTGIEYYGVFDGVNERRGTPVAGEFYRLVFGPAKNIDLVGDDYVSFECEAELLADDSKPEGESQYYQFDIGGVA